MIKISSIHAQMRCMKICPIGIFKKKGINYEYYKI